MYRDYRALLFYIAAQKFNVPVCEAETLVQEAWLAFLTSNATIQNPKAWLVATVCNVSRLYWRRRGRIERVEGQIDATEVADDRNNDRLERRLVVGKLLSLLTSRDREILRLRYLERLTVVAIAEHLDTTTGYAEKRIGIALKRAREIHAGLLARGHRAIQNGSLADDSRMAEVWKPTARH